MTYKKILTAIIEEEANNFLKNVLNENHITYRFISWYKTDLEMDDDLGSLLWTVTLDIHMNDFTSRIVTVGGAADDIVGLAASVIWKGFDKKDTIWMARKETRVALGIKELKLA